MSRSALHPATAREADALWPAVRAARLFETHAAFLEARDVAPWRVQVTGRGEAVMLEEWRPHLDVLAMSGVWCSESRVSALVDQARSIAASRGFGRLLSPLVSEEVASAYERAGLEVHTSIVALQFCCRAWAEDQAPLPAGVRIRPALAGDIPALVRIDAECFDEFWRYDAGRLTRYFVEDRLMVAQGPGGIIGYTLATVLHDSGTLGRLAVQPASRRRGIGEALVREALGHFARSGAESVTACTQAENHASRDLYRKVGLTELSGRLFFLIGPTRRR